MPHALVTKDAAVELAPGQPFVDGQGVSHPAAVLRLWTAKELATIGVHPITEPAPPPAGKRVLSTDLTVRAGRPVRVAVHEPVPLATQKAEKLAQVDAAFRANLAKGFAVIIDGQPEILQCRGAEDRANWARVHLAAWQAVAAGQGEAPYAAPIRCESNASYTVSNAKALTMMQGLTEWVDAKLAACWALKDSIGLAKTAAELAAIKPVVG